MVQVVQVVLQVLLEQVVLLILQVLQVNPEDQVLQPHQEQVVQQV